MGLVAALPLACRTSKPDPPHSPPTSLAVGQRPRAVATGDLDGDADLDVVVANSASNNATVLLNTGGGRLAPAAQSPVSAGNEPSDVAVADFDADGHADLVFANHETSLVTVLAGDGRGNFAPMLGSPFDTGSRPHVHGLAVADFDGDGSMDVAVDSADDDRVHVLFGSDHGLTAARSFIAGDLPYYRIGAGDVLGDGKPELLVPSQRDRTVWILGADGPSNLARVGGPVALTDKPWMVRSADIDEDGRRDLVVVLGDAIGVLAGRQDGSFESMMRTPVAIPGATEIAVGDLDADGAADIAVGSWDGDEVIVLWGGSLSRQSEAAGRRPIGLAIADLDGDGAAELLAASALDNVLSILKVQRR
jgi:hypothetical protein